VRRLIFDYNSSPFYLIPPFCAFLPSPPTNHTFYSLTSCAISACATAINALRAASVVVDTRGMHLLSLSISFPLASCHAWSACAGCLRGLRKTTQQLVCMRDATAISYLFPSFSCAQHHLYMLFLRVCITHILACF
jgi:hypothetical protein